MGDEYKKRFLKCLKKTLEPLLKEIGITYYGRMRGIVVYAALINQKYLQLNFNLKDIVAAYFYIHFTYPDNIWDKAIYPVEPYIRQKEAWSDNVEQWVFKDEEDLNLKLRLIFNVVKEQVLPFIHGNININMQE